MKRYLVFYYTEQNDVCTDLEHIVEAYDISAAIKAFEYQIKTFKRITTITELPYGE